MKAFPLSHRIIVRAVTPLGRLATQLSAIGLVASVCALSARGQSSDLSGTIKTKDVGSGALSVNYFFESSAADSLGYFQVEVAALNGASPSQRDLEIVLYANSSSKQNQSNVAFHFNVMLPEGATTAQTAIPFFMVSDESPRQAHVNWDIGVWEEGRDIEQTRQVETVGLTNPRDASRTPGRSLPFHKWDRVVSEATTLHLLDDGATPSNARSLRLWLAQENGSVNAVVNASMLLAQNFDLTRDPQRISSFRHLSSAPDIWQYYLQFRIVVVEEGVLAKAIGTRPVVAQALKHYVAAGGNLILIGGPERNGKKTLDQWLLGSRSSTAQPITTWRGVEPTIDRWWTRDDLANNIGSTPNKPASYTKPTVVQSATPDPFGGLEPADTINWDPRLNVAKELLRIQGSQVPRHLSAGGIARDVWTGFETYFELKYGAMQAVESELETWLFADDEGLLEDMVNGMGSTAAVARRGSGSMGPTVSYGVVQMGAYEGNPALPAGFQTVDLEWHGLSETMVEWWFKLRAWVNGVEAQDTSSVALRPHVLGHVAVVEGDLTTYPIEVLTALVSGLSDSPALATSSINDQMWSYRNLIDAVGKPPVWTFCAIVLLFGLILGPGLLIFTGWMRRRSLLIFLVPSISLVATLAIVVYEVFHEGFGTSIRISSVLAVDEDTGEGFAWSRQTYFSGWPPREGLTFPKDVYCRPVNTEQIFYLNHYNVPVDPHPRDSARSHIYVGRDKSHWQSALRPREQQQFLIGHPAKLSVPLKVSHTDAKHVRIKNLTQEELPFAIVRDDQQGFYVVENLAAGAEAECESQSKEYIGGLLARNRAIYTSSLPEGLVSLRSAIRLSGSESADVIDRAWQRTVVEDSNLFNLPPHGFVTLLRSNDSIYVPLQGNSSQNTHLMIGRLVW